MPGLATADHEKYILYECLIAHRKLADLGCALDLSDRCGLRAASSKRAFDGYYSHDVVERHHAAFKFSFACLMLIWPAILLDN